MEKVASYFCDFKILTKVNNHLHNGRKFAQSGHPGFESLHPCKTLHLFFFFHSPSAPSRSYKCRARAGFATMERDNVPGSSNHETKMS
jgi:hypothetical protein